MKIAACPGDMGASEEVALSFQSESWPLNTEERAPLSARRPKTPRDEPIPGPDENADSHTSPNQRVRKHARPSELVGEGVYVTGGIRTPVSSTIFI